MTQHVEKRLDSVSPAVLSLFRAVFGFLFAMFGTSHVFDWPITFGIPAGSWPVWWAGVIEVITGLLILVGLFTRAAALVASGAMAVAYFWQHQPNALWPIVGPELGGNGGLSAILFCFGFLLIVFMGPGSVALDNVIGRGRR